MKSIINKTLTVKCENVYSTVKCDYVSIIFKSTTISFKMIEPIIVCTIEIIKCVTHKCISTVFTSKFIAYMLSLI